MNIAEPKYYLNDDWEFERGFVSTDPQYFGLGGEEYITDEKELELVRMIESVLIEVAEFADTRELGSDDNYEYLNTELGMNIIVPKGKILEMRFSVHFKPNQDIVVIDGFPNDLIREKSILDGKISIGLNNAFRYVPIAGQIAADLVQIEISKEFNIGNLRNVDIDFSGPGSRNAQWYFRKDGIKNDLRVGITVKMDKAIENLTANVAAAWRYKPPGLFKKVTVSGHEREVKIY